MSDLFQTAADLPEFAQGFIEAAFFTAPEGGEYEGAPEPPAGVWTLDDLAPGALGALAAHALRFLIAHSDLIGAAVEKGGRGGDYTERAGGADLWYTAAGHGVGYWDRGLGGLGDALCEAAARHGVPELIPGRDTQGRPRLWVEPKPAPLTDAERAEVEALTGGPVPPLPRVSTRHGAPMGRTADRPPRPGEGVRAVRMHLDPGGYDAGGAYWGVGAPLWRVLGEDGAAVAYLRAADARAALGAAGAAP